MREFGARQALFYALILVGFLASLWLKFVASGVLRGNLYDVLLVFVVASATFSTFNLMLLKPASEGAHPGKTRQRQSALNRNCVAAWAAFAVFAEWVQGLLAGAAGEDVMGRFDSADLAAYLAGASLSYVANRLLYVDRTGPQG